MEDFLNVAYMVSRVPRIDEYVVQVGYHADIEHVLEDVIHELLKRGGDDEELVGTKVCAECHLPLIAFSNADKFIGTAEVDFGEDFGGVEAV